MKKIVCIFLMCIMLFCSISCNAGDKTGESPESQKTIDYTVIIESIDAAISSMHNCAVVQQDWLGVTNNLPYLYSDTNYEGGNNNNAKEAGKQCYLYRQDARKELEKAKEMLKGGSGQLHDAVQEYYLAASTYLDFISNFPEGYSKVTWNKKWTELEQACSSAANKIELYV